MGRKLPDRLISESSSDNLYEFTGSVKTTLEIWYFSAENRSIASFENGNLGNRYRTMSPTLNWLLSFSNCGRYLLSIAARFFSTVSRTLAKFSGLLASTGLTPVVALTELLYDFKADLRATLKFRSPVECMRFSISRKVLIARSAAKLLFFWFAEVKTCFIPFSRRYFA